MAVVTIGERITFVKGVLSVVCERSNLYGRGAQYARRQIPNQLIRPGFAVLQPTELLAGRARLNAVPKWEFMMSLRLPESKFRTLIDMYQEQQDDMGLRNDHVIGLYDERIYYEERGATPSRALVPSTTADTTAKPGYVRYYAQFAITFQNDPEQHATAAGKDPQLNEAMYQGIEIKATESRVIDFV